MYNCNGKSMEDRYACKSCGSWVMTNMKHLKCHAFFLPNISQTDGRFKPSCHIFYSQLVKYRFKTPFVVLLHKNSVASSIP